MEELIKKEDGFTSWRAKINRVFGALSWLLSGTEEKSVLASEHGKIGWQAVKEEAKTEESQNQDEMSSLHVDGILNATAVAVTGAAKFLCRIDADAGILASSLTVQDSVLLRKNGMAARISLDKNGLLVGSVVVKDREVNLPPLTKIGGASIGYDRGVLTFYGKANPCKMDLEHGGAEFPYGLSCRTVVFPNGQIDGEGYTGRASSASRLADAVEIFGNNFDGTENVQGCIENCTGLTLEEDSEIRFKGALKDDTVKVASGIMEWTGCFRPKNLEVNTEHYCEWYPAVEYLESGDVISVSFIDGKEAYCKASASTNPPLAVVSSDYAVCIGQRTDRSYPACNRGRVKAKVEGKVAAGTKLVASSTAGALRPMNSKDKAYEAWAIALESSESEAVKLVKIHIL